MAGGEFEQDPTLVIAELERAAHGWTRDWPGPWPTLVDPVPAWASLGSPHVLYALPRAHVNGRTLLERAWLLADGSAGADTRDVVAAPEHADPSALAEALLPHEVLRSLERSGQHDDLVVVTSDELRALAWPMLPVPGRAGERLNSFAAVTMLPSLSWGAHALRRAYTPAREAGADIVAYVHPDVDLPCVDTLIDGRDYPDSQDDQDDQDSQPSHGSPTRDGSQGNHRSKGSHGLRVDSLADIGPALSAHGPRIMLITAHGTLTDDGSVDLRDHLGRLAPPDEICTWAIPAISLIAGCRTGASNAIAPLHLAEAALCGGAAHVIAVTNRTTDEVVDDVLAATLRRLGVGRVRSPAHSPSQALQSALQQFDRAYPLSFSDMSTWSLVHLGLPGSALG